MTDLDDDFAGIGGVTQNKQIVHTGTDPGLIFIMEWVRRLESQNQKMEQRMQALEKDNDFLRNEVKRLQTDVSELQGNPRDPDVQNGPGPTSPKRIQKSNDLSPFILITGAVGGNHEKKVNGVFIQEDEEQNDRPLFRKGEYWLRMDTDGNWSVASEADKNENSNRAWLYCTEKNLQDPSEALTWKLNLGTPGHANWEIQQNLEVRHIPFLPVLISGAVGPNATYVNGIFKPTQELYSGRIQFRKHGSNQEWLRFILDDDVDKRGCWSVCTSKAGDISVLLRCVEQNVNGPTEALSWKLLHGDVWKIQNNISVTYA